MPTVRILTSVLLWALAAGAWAQSRAYPSGAYQGPVFEDPALSALELRPTWRAPLDAPTAVLIDDTLYYPSAGKLIAANVATGEQHWSRPIDSFEPLAAAGDLLLVGGEALTALHPATGEVAWRYDLPGLSVRSITPLADGVAISGNYDEGGAELWRAGRSAGPLAVRDGAAYLLDADWSGLGRPPYTLEFVVVNAQDGSELERWRYESADPSAYLPANEDRVLLYPDHLYVVRRDGGAVAEFPLGGGSEPTRLFAPAYQQGTYRLGLSRGAMQGSTPQSAPGLLLFETAVHELRGMKVLDADPKGGLSGDIAYAGPGSPISRLDVHGTTLYVGRTDGLVTAVDLVNARQLYFVQAGGFGFGPTLAAGSQVVLQTTEEILVVEAGPHGYGPSGNGSGGNGARGNITLVTQYGTVTANADLVAARDGTGQWQPLEGHDGNYTFAVESGSYSLAVLCFEAGAPEVTVYNFPVADLPYLRHACGGGSEPLTEYHELYGEVHGLQPPPERPWHLFEVAFGRHSSGSYLPRPGENRYSLMASLETGDLVAVRTPGLDAPDRAILIRDLTIEEPTRIDLDFRRPGALLLEQHAVRSEGASSQTLIRGQLRTCNGTVVAVREVGAPAGSATDPGRAGGGETPLDAPASPSLLYAALPASERRACDRYELSALELGDAGELRLQAAVVSEPHDVTLVVPMLPKAPKVTFTPGAAANMQVQWLAEGEAGVYFFAADVGPVQWRVFQSALLEPWLELPDLTELADWPGAVRVGGEVSDVGFGVISAGAGAWEALLGWESVLGYRRFSELMVAPARLDVAYVAVDEVTQRSSP